MEIDQNKIMQKLDEMMGHVLTYDLSPETQQKFQKLEEEDCTDDFYLYALKLIVDYFNKTEIDDAINNDIEFEYRELKYLPALYDACDKFLGTSLSE